MGLQHAHITILLHTSHTQTAATLAPQCKNLAQAQKPEHLMQLRTSAVSSQQPRAPHVPTVAGSSKAGHAWTWLLLLQLHLQQLEPCCSAACCLLHLKQDLIDSLDAECEGRVVLVPANTQDHRADTPDDGHKQETCCRCRH